MSRIAPTEELKLIESIVADHPKGLGISAIEAEIERRQGMRPNRRTLQRRLQKLIDARRLTKEGESIALVYKSTADAEPRTDEVKAPETDLYVPVSPEGAAIRDRMRLPLMHRRPVGYR